MMPILKQAEQWPERCAANREDPDRPGNLIHLKDEPPRGYPRVHLPENYPWLKEPGLNDLYNEQMQAQMTPMIDYLNRNPAAESEKLDFDQTDRHWPAEYGREWK
jgi:hypothetical protein